jgi:hypothetical protein
MGKKSKCNKNIRQETLQNENTRKSAEKTVLLDKTTKHEDNMANAEKQ